MSALACNLQTAALSDQQELRKAALKLVYSWIVSPALWAQSLTRRFWFQKLFARRDPVCYEPDYKWKCKPGCEPFLTGRHGDDRCTILDNSCHVLAFEDSISSKSSVATLPMEGSSRRSILEKDLLRHACVRLCQGETLTEWLLPLSRTPQRSPVNCC